MPWYKPSEVIFRTVIARSTLRNACKAATYRSAWSVRDRCMLVGFSLGRSSGRTRPIRPPLSRARLGPKAELELFDRFMPERLNRALLVTVFRASGDNSLASSSLASSRTRIAGSASASLFMVEMRLGAREMRAREAGGHASQMVLVMRSRLRRTTGLLWDDKRSTIRAKKGGWVAICAQNAAEMRKICGI